MLLNNQIGFIFDHDGVIADNEKLHEKAWRELFLNHKVDVSNEDFLLKIKGYSTKDGITNIFPDISSAEKVKLHDEKAKIYDDFVIKSLKPIEGVINFIKASKQINIKIAIASAGHRRRIDYSIQKFGLSKYIDTILSVEDITKNKPDPEVYIKTIKKLGLNPKICFIFEDSPTGLEAGNLSGSNVIFVNSSKLKSEEIKQKYILEIPNFININPEKIINDK